MKVQLVTPVSEARSGTNASGVYSCDELGLVHVRTVPHVAETFYGRQLGSSFTLKEISPGGNESRIVVGDQSWIFIGRTFAEAETPVRWPHDVKN